MKYFNLLNSPHRVLQMTKDRLFLMSIVIYFNNVSILQPLFDSEMMSLTASGLIEYWTKEFIDERTESNSNTQRLPKRLRLQNVLAIFEICSVLLAICVFVFVFEKLGEQFVCIKMFIDNITY